MQNLFDIQGKAALVTGGSRGIGLMIARGYVEAGARVYISSRNAGVCEQVAAELSKSGSCTALPADLSTEAEANRLATELSAREPSLHILVNNAGANWGAPLAEYPDSAWDKVLALNVKSVFHLTRALVPALASSASDSDPARVINIGSIVWKLGFPDVPIYGTAKAGVVAFSKALALEEARRGITVNVVSPGLLQDETGNKDARAADQMLGDRVPVGHAGRSADVIRAVLFFVTPAAEFVTGQVLEVAGGARQ